MIRWIALLALFALVGCGPIIGAGMVAGSGVKSFDVVAGDLQKLKPGSRVLVVGPFAKTESAYYICRGEEAANFTTAFNSAGLFQADFYLGDRFEDSQEWLNALKLKTPAQLQTEFGLQDAPDLLLSGVILQRSTVAAPMQGVLMDVAYRLEFFDLRTQQVTSIEVQVKDLFQKCITSVVSDLAARVTAR